jgi:hypothetical protein
MINSKELMAKINWGVIQAAAALAKQDTIQGRQMKHIIEREWELEEERALDIAWAREHKRIDELFKKTN